jgi:hypothetical protein
MFPKGFAANQQATICKGKELVFKGVISKDDNNLARGARANN